MLTKTVDSLLQGNDGGSREGQPFCHSALDAESRIYEWRWIPDQVGDDNLLPRSSWDNILLVVLNHLSVMPNHSFFLAHFFLLCTLPSVMPTFFLSCRASARHLVPFPFKCKSMRPLVATLLGVTEGRVSLGETMGGMPLRITLWRECPSGDRGWSAPRGDTLPVMPNEVRHLILVPFPRKRESRVFIKKSGFPFTREWRKKTLDPRSGRGWQKESGN